jgi:hypothetical protein
MMPIATTIREVGIMKLSPMKALKLSAAALILSAFAYGGVSAAEKKKKEAAPKPAVCNSLKAEGECEARQDCTWVAAVMDKKSGKEKRRAYCRAKPKAPAKKKT